ncbi:hypothetical protein BHE74_00025541 [Ensete ventricosum]|nr:hypothetical protein BHE74_00025541 [Ensete ventricosum]
MEASESGAAAFGEPLIKHRGWKTMPFVIGTLFIESIRACLHGMRRVILPCSCPPKMRSMVGVHAGNETFEKLATIGTLSNLLVYLTVVFHLSSVAAATSLNVFNGTTNLATILGAFVSDTYLGRYATLGFSSMASLLVLTLPALLLHLFPLLRISLPYFVCEAEPVNKVMMNKEIDNRNQ